MGYNEIHQQQFEQVARQPMAWLLQAESLKKSADILHAEITRKLATEELEGLSNFAPSYMMLAGLAIENQIKGLCISQDPTVVKDGKIVWGGNGHTTKDLFTRAGVTLNSEEESLIDRLSEFVVWAGRYPQAKKASYYQSRSDTNPPMTSVTFDFNAINVLYKKLTAMYQQP